MNRKIPVEVYSRVCGYYRPVLQWNPGKKEEFAQRVGFVLPTAEASHASRPEKEPCR